MFMIETSNNRKALRSGSLGLQTRILYYAKRLCGFRKTPLVTTQTSYIRNCSSLRSLFFVQVIYIMLQSFILAYPAHLILPFSPPFLDNEKTCNTAFDTKKFLTCHSGVPLI